MTMLCRYKRYISLSEERWDKLQIIGFRDIYIYFFLRVRARKKIIFSIHMSPFTVIQKLILLDTVRFKHVDVAQKISLQIYNVITNTDESMHVCKVSLYRSIYWSFFHQLMKIYICKIGYPMHVRAIIV